MAKTKPKTEEPVRLVKDRLFWEISRAGKQVKIRAGKMNGTFRDSNTIYTTLDKAKAKYDELLAKQRRLGYFVPGEMPACTIPIARDAALEAAIREDREDPAPYLVYADWLGEQGSPLGEMLVLAQKQPKRAREIAAQVGLPDAKLVQVTWRHGLWRSLYFHNQIDWMDDSFDVLPMARTLFASPLCAALEELRIGVVRWEHHDQPAILAAAGQHAWAKDLVRLSLGDFTEDIDMDHHTIGEVGKVISKSFPNLEALKLHSGAKSWSSGENFGIAGLDLPTLKTLVIETCGMSSKRLKAFTKAKLPRLEKLELWFGERERDATAKIGDAVPIWDGTLFPKLVHLGLCNSELVSDFVRLVPMSKLAAQLETFDLSKGTMNDEDADELGRHAKRFKKLKRLILDESFVEPAALKRLKKAFPGVQVSAKDPKDRYDWDPNMRYVSVSE